MGNKKLFGLTSLYALAMTSVASAQNVDIFGPAAKAVDNVRMSQNIGIFAAVIFVIVGACALWMKSMKIAITAIFIIAGTVLWYTGGDIAKSVIPTSGTAIAP